MASLGHSELKDGGINQMLHTYYMLQNIVCLGIYFQDFVMFLTLKQEYNVDENFITFCAISY